MPICRALTSGKQLHQSLYGQNRQLSISTMMSTTLIPISCDHLRQLIELMLSNEDTPTNVLILDCRPFLIHNDSHIAKSINIHCPAIIRRRTGNRLPLRTIIPDQQIRDRLLADFYYPIVLYEESDIGCDTIGNYVSQCLQHEVGLKNVHFLQGGFVTFQQLFPYFCTKGSTFSNPLNTLSSVNISSRSPVGTHSHTWPLKSTPKGVLTPRTPKNNNLSVDVTAPLSFGSEQAEPVEILPYLYLGSEYHASCKAMLKNIGITALLNVSHTCPNHFQDCFIYKSIPIEDSKSEDISIWFSEAIDFIDCVRNSNGKVLIHCHAGISRSATICMAYLMATKRLRMEEAYEYVKSRRKIISPNFNFMGQLLGFETQVFSPNNPLRDQKQVLMEPLSPLLSKIASSSTFISSKQTTPLAKTCRGSSAPSSPSRIRSDCERLVFDFTKVPFNDINQSISHSNTSLKSSQVLDSPILM
ncbi:dual specificity protein phosphatase 1-like [Oppia nitens]|uniref:dual specificity protein phosphatase 1-like n=1 Tax=Oppia nitens TaxID=1686743 RepID=UPI0023DA0D05|nr:dual specificity protein phosphatase 1-like [Oppia nitens]